MLGKTAIYQFWSAEGELLYVGISKQFDKRLRYHIKNAEVWPEIERVVVRFENTRRQALAEERRLILERGPSCNVMIKRKHYGPVRDRVLACIDKDWHTEIQLAKYTGATIEEVRAAANELVREGILRDSEWCPGIWFYV